MNAMKFSINHIKIENFRCFEKLETDLWNVTSISASNEVGKSTVATAILWVLTGKSADGDSTFAIVPMGKEGSVSPSVTLDCILDDKPVTLNRTYKAKFARDKTFQGYETVTSINGLECGVKQFQSWITQNICDEKVFKLLVNPKTFAENPPKDAKQLEWQSQRMLLMQIIGGQQTDKEIAASSNKWLDLQEPLQRFDNASQYLTFLTKQYKELQKSLDSVDVRIEQQEKNIKHVNHTEEDVERIASNLKLQAAKLKAQNEDFKRSNNLSRTDEIRAQIESLQAEKKRLTDKYNEDMLVYERTKAAYQQNAAALKKELEETMSTVQTYLQAIQQLKDTKVKENCPTCGAKLDEKAIKASKAQLASRIKTGEDKTGIAKKKAIELKSKYDEAVNKAETLMQPTFPAKVYELEEEIQFQMAKLAAANTQEDMPEYAEKMEELESQMDEVKQEYFTIRQNAELEKSIEQIENERKEAVQSISETQRLMDLAKEFVSMKCRNAEDSINALFQNVRFKLFEKNKSNDEVRETCILTFNGIEYKDLSASTKIIAGFEVLSAFQKFYNVYVPVCCDNMESVTSDIKNEAQIIKFYVKQEPCPKCGSFNHTRRLPDGTWKCLDCGEVFRKKMEIKEG
jgi:DNA repair exonuclease SbcCD ATPase subunit